MLRRFKTGLLVILAATATAGAKSAQTTTGTCASKDTTSARLIAGFTTMVTKTTLAATIERKGLGITNVTPSQIVLVTDKSICTKAAVAMDAITTEKRARYKLYVVTLGTSYGVLDNTVVAPGYALAYVFDHNWKYMSNKAIY
jgi:hypothetical protein